MATGNALQRRSNSGGRHPTIGAYQWKTEDDLATVSADNYFTYRDMPADLVKVGFLFEVFGPDYVAVLDVVQDLGAGWKTEIVSQSERSPFNVGDDVDPLQIVEGNDGRRYQNTSGSTLAMPASFPATGFTEYFPSSTVDRLNNGGVRFTGPDSSTFDILIAPEVADIDGTAIATTEEGLIPQIYTPEFNSGGLTGFLDSLINSERSRRTPFSVRSLFALAFNSGVEGERAKAGTDQGLIGLKNDTGNIGHAYNIVEAVGDLARGLANNSSVVEYDVNDYATEVAATPVTIPAGYNGQKLRIKMRDGDRNQIRRFTIDGTGIARNFNKQIVGNRSSILQVEMRANEFLDLYWSTVQDEWRVNHSYWLHSDDNIQEHENGKCKISFNTGDFTNGPEQVIDAVIPVTIDVTGGNSPVEVSLQDFSSTATVGNTLPFGVDAGSDYVFYANDTTATTVRVGHRRFDGGAQAPASTRITILDATLDYAALPA